MTTFYLNIQPKTNRLVVEKQAGEVVETFQANDLGHAYSLMKEKYYYNHKPGYGYFL